MEEDTSLYKFLLKTKVELLIRKRKRETEEFKEEVAINHIIFAIDKAIKEIEGQGGRDDAS